MSEKVIFSSEHILITKGKDGYYIESYKRGMSLQKFNKIIAEHPEIRITNFTILKTALIAAPKPSCKFGEVKQRIHVEVTDDELKVYLTLCVNPIELLGERKSKLIGEIFQELTRQRIVYGIKKEALIAELKNNKQTLIAEGKPAFNGEDSVIKMYEVAEAEPEAKDDGNVDHYELSLINKVNKGEWLGERIDPTDGIPGKSVRGNLIVPMRGKMYPLVYDRRSVYEKYDGKKTTLHASHDGAVHYEGDRIAVSNHLEIKNNVDFETGNIDFDGYLTVRGTVEDNFSVVADKDIEILGTYGVGSAKDIISRAGSIFIKGGIAGNKRAVIRSKKDIYTKFVADADIICEGSVHIGFYSLNSNIKAKEVILDSPKGRIIGGNIEAEIKVVSSIIGAPSEKRTSIKITGFIRDELKKSLEENVIKLKEMKEKLTSKKQEVSIYTALPSIPADRTEEFERLTDEFADIKNDLKELEQDQKNIANYLRTKGEGEIRINKKIYPNVILEMKKITKEIQTPLLNRSFYILKNEIKEM
jgi:uncharacterized protein (DUF342 family)